MSCSGIEWTMPDSGCDDFNYTLSRTVICNKKDLEYFRSICCPTITVESGTGMPAGFFYASPDCKPQYNLKMGWIGYNYFNPPPVESELIRIE